MSQVAVQSAEKVNDAFFTNDAVVLGLLMLILAFVFVTSSAKNGFWKKFYTYIPALLLCYFIPSIFNSLGIINGEASKLYFVSSRYLLPCCLVLLTLSIDLPEILRLGIKPVLVFLSGTVGIVIGGPMAILIVSAFSPDLVGGAGPDAVWRGMTTIAGSWIGGGANQTAMKEVFEVGDELFSKMIAVDVIVANIWMGFLLYGASRSKKMDAYFKADSSIIDHVKEKIETYRATISRVPSLTDLMVILGIGFTVTAIAHIIGDNLAPWIQENAPYLEKYSLTSKFFWIIVSATTVGLILSFTKLRKYEGAGASRMGSAMLYVLVASIGMKMDIGAIFENPGLFLVGLIWISFHIIFMLTVSRILRAPFFFVAVGSQANIGGAASAPVVAGAFSPSLAPVGVLLAVLGYAIGTYGAYFCGLLMQAAAG
ncbi:MAG: DUF819 family protein [Bacteroidales bacterium]|nr:DUF819 family protein [Bacteroidales bacterium]